MIVTNRKFAFNLQLFILIQIMLLICEIEAQFIDLNGVQTCGTDEINHSALVECGESACNGTSNDQGLHLPEVNEVILISSTRSGVRFRSYSLGRMRLVENEQEKMLNVNTTLSINSDKVVGQKIIGFGSTLDAVEMLSQINAGTFNDNYGRTLKDLIDSKQHGLSYTMFKFNFAKNHITPSDLSMVLHHLEPYLDESGTREVPRLNVVLNMTNFSTQEDIENLRILAETFNSSDSIQAHAIALTQPHFESQENFIQQLRDLFGEVKILAKVEADQAPYVLDHLVSIKANFDGLLVESKSSVSYDVYDYLRGRKDGIELLVVSRPRPNIRIHGDWSNAQLYATEILNHLQHGVNGYIENQFAIVDLLDNTSNKMEDCAIYSLRKSNQVHFRGPLYYAAGHFSRFLGMNSVPIEIDLFTQPNMFAAKYSAFLTANNYIVAVVLNDNEHLLPFRLALNNKIETYTALESKSFNTFIFKNML